MSWLKELLGSGRKETEARYQFDLRDELEKQQEREGHHSLGGEDEEIAQNLCRLCAQGEAQYRSDKEAYEKTAAEIGRVGEHLCSSGGSKRMARIAYRVAFLRGDTVPGSHTTEMESYWVGICGWQL